MRSKDKASVRYATVSSVRTSSYRPSSAGLARTPSIPVACSDGSSLQTRRAVLSAETPSIMVRVWTCGKRAITLKQAGQRAFWLRQEARGKCKNLAAEKSAEHDRPREQQLSQLLPGIKVTFYILELLALLYQDPRNTLKMSIIYLKPETVIPLLDARSAPSQSFMLRFGFHPSFEIVQSQLPATPHKLTCYTARVRNLYKGLLAVRIILRSYHLSYSLDLLRPLTSQASS